MARNNKKYVYLTIGILRNSETHKALIADADEHNTKQLPTVAGIRLSEYYQLKMQGQIGAVISNHDASFVPDKNNADTGEMEFREALSNAADADEAWPD